MSCNSYVHYTLMQWNTKHPKGQIKDTGKHSSFVIQLITGVNFLIRCKTVAKMSTQFSSSLFSFFKEMVKISPLKTLLMSLKKTLDKKNMRSKEQNFFFLQTMLFMLSGSLLHEDLQLWIFFISAAGRDWIRYEQRFYFFLFWFLLLKQDCHCFYLLFYLGFRYNM